MDTGVVIIGGGAAGIGAARRLAGAGLSTRLLEAGSRLGGRAWTREIKGLELDIGCGWLHSADRNAWTAIAREAGIEIDQSHAAWRNQYRDLGFPRERQEAAWKAFSEWTHRMEHDPPASDRASDALAQTEWNEHIRTIVGFISGGPLEEMSVADYVTYDQNSTDDNWRLRSGYGALVARGFPAGVGLHLATPVKALSLEPSGVAVTTNAGTLRARAVILTVSTRVLAGESIQLPRELEPWRDSARNLPLGRNEKLFLEIAGDSAFEPETHVIGDPHTTSTGSYYIRPFGRPIIECFLGGDSAGILDDKGAAAAFDYCVAQIVALFGADARKALRPLAASAWSLEARFGGGYSYARPRQSKAREALARPFDGRVFFAGEATSAKDFSTAHGAHDSGVRAAEEVIAALK